MIFMDLHKAYDALDKSMCLEILEGYGVGNHHVGSSGHFGGGLQWWQGRAAITRRRLRELKE